MAKVAVPKFTLADVMILVGATAFGLGCYVLVDNQVFRGQRYLFGLLGPPPGTWNSRLVADRAAGAISSMLVMFGGLTFALPLMVRSRTGPIRRRLSRGPGMTACFASLAGMTMAAGVGGLSIGLRKAIDGSINLPANFWNQSPLFDNVVIFAGFAVASTWVVLWGTGRWRAKPDGFDRVGRLLGVLWIASALVFATRQLLG